MKTGLPARLEEVRKFIGSQKEVSQQLSISSKSWQNYEAGKSVPGGEVFEGLARLGFNANWLLAGEGHMRRDQIGTIQIGEPGVTWNKSDAFVMVPRYNVAASAGGGSDVQSEQVVDHLAFKREWVSSIGLQHDKLALISATGDSMEPTIKSGDLLLVDTRHNDSVTDGIYVLRMDGGLIAKRLQHTLDGGLIVRSDNKIYQELIASKDQIQFINIVGRVVWTGSRI